MSTAKSAARKPPSTIEKDGVVWQKRQRTRVYGSTRPLAFDVPVHDLTSAWKSRDWKGMVYASALVGSDPDLSLRHAWVFCQDPSRCHSLAEANVKKPTTFGTSLLSGIFDADTTQGLSPRRPVPVLAPSWDGSFHSQDGEHVLDQECHGTRLPDSFREDNGLLRG